MQLLLAWIKKTNTSGTTVAFHNGYSLHPAMKVTTAFYICPKMIVTLPKIKEIIVQKDPL